VALHEALAREDLGTGTVGAKKLSRPCCDSSMLQLVAVCSNVLHAWLVGCESEPPWNRGAPVQKTHGFTVF